MANSNPGLPDNGTPSPPRDFARIIELCDALQQYETYANQWNRYAGMYLEAKEQSEVDEGQVPPVLDVELQRAVDMFPSVEKLIRRFANWASELVNRLVLHRLIALLPSMTNCRIRCRPPHDCGYFDWKAFSRELLAVTDEAVRLAAVKPILYSPVLDKNGLIKLRTDNKILENSDSEITRAKQELHAIEEPGSNWRRFRIPLAELRTRMWNYPSEWNHPVS